MCAHYDPATHPLCMGQTVTIFSLFIFKHPFVEGRGVIVGWVPEIPNLYRVRFEDEQLVHERFAHPGKWQTDPDGMLRELLDHWRLTVTPEIANEFFPNDPPSGDRVSQGEVFELDGRLIQTDPSRCTSQDEPEGSK